MNLDIATLKFSYNEVENIHVPKLNLVVSELRAAVAVTTDDGIAAIAALTPSADTYLYFTSATAAALGAITPMGRSILDDANGPAVLVTIGAEPAITAGTTAQYWRGDKSWQALNGAAVANTPAGSIAATTVQAAIDELDSEKQPLDASLTALATYNTNGILVQTAADTFAGRALTAPAAGITVTNGDGVAGNPTLVLANDLAALEALSGTNTIYYRSAVDTWTAVTIGGGLSFAAGSLSSSITQYTDEMAQDATGAMVDASLVYVDATPLLTRAALTGDATASQGSNALTLATVNSNVGSFGSATQVATFTVNAKGLITAAANVTITPAVGSITGLGTGVATALAVNVGSAGALVTFNGAGGTPSSLTLTNATGLVTAGLVNDAVTYAKIQNVSATDRLLGRSTAGAGDVEEITCTAAGRALIDDADATAQRATLGLGTMATQAASAVAITGGTITGITAPTLTALTLESSVTNVGSGYATAGWRKEVSGRVHLEGYLLGGGGASGLTVTTLPVGARPLVHQIFPCPIASGGVVGISELDVQTDGRIFWYTSNTSANLSMSGISFQT